MVENKSNGRTNSLRAEQTKYTPRFTESSRAERKTSNNFGYAGERGKSTTVLDFLEEDNSSNESFSDTKSPRANKIITSTDNDVEDHY